jgi:hypothetical protein
MDLSVVSRRMVVGRKSTPRQLIAEEYYGSVISYGLELATKKLQGRFHGAAACSRITQEERGVRSYRIGRPNRSVLCVRNKTTEQGRAHNGDERGRNPGGSVAGAKFHAER